MDAVHETEKRPWIGEVMSAVDFKRNWTDALKNQQQADDQKMREALMQIMNVPDAVLKIIEGYCSPSTLCCGEESMDTAKLPNHDDLVTLRLQRQDLEKRKADEAYRMKTCHHFRKICFLSKVNCTKRGVPSKFQEEDRVPSNEVVLTVQVFKPIKMPVGMKKVRLGAQNFSFKIQVELAMLSCQELRSLREKITCISDAAIVGDFSENPDRVSDQRASELYKSGFFLHRKHILQ
uniref:snRNA-activating protein complex subunit 3 n=1 Tax=Rhipicephalus zambeziensis TaxID=60191 RepID=A0A224Z4R7_9ACAR